MFASLLGKLRVRLRAVGVEPDHAAASGLFAGQTDLTISSRCGMAQIDEMRGSPPHVESLLINAFGDGLDRLEVEHCFASIMADIDRAQRVLDVLRPYATYIRAVGLRAP